MSVRPDPERFYYCEPANATGNTWHIREADGPREVGGGIGTGSLCGVVRAEFGWDLVPHVVFAEALADSRVVEGRSWRTCPRCVEALAGILGERIPSP